MLRQLSGISWNISSLHDPQGGTAFPSEPIAMTRLMPSSPAVSIEKIALRSAHSPREHAVSTQMPVYILPDDDSIAAATLPTSMYLDTILGFSTPSAASYRSFHICSMLSKVSPTAGPWGMSAVSLC